MRVLVDTNILLDVLCNRRNFAEDSLSLFRYCEAGVIDGCISALSIPNIVYVMRKELDKEKIKDVLFILSSTFSIVDLNERDLLKAADADFADYEDAIQAVTAARIKADYIATRNTKDFKKSAVRAVVPERITDKI